MCVWVFVERGGGVRDGAVASPVRIQSTPVGGRTRLALLGLQAALLFKVGFGDLLYWRKFVLIGLFPSSLIPQRCVLGKFEIDLTSVPTVFFVSDRITTHER